MADTTCPGCSADLTPDDINIKEGVAFCRACDKVWRLSELAGVGRGRSAGSPSASSTEDAEEEARADEVAAREAPDGCWLRDVGVGAGAETVVGARCRSSTGWFFVLFSAFWNSITWVFVIVAVSGMMHPAGPPPQMLEDAKGNPELQKALANGLGADAGGDWIMLAAMIPFVLVGLVTGAFGLVGVLGKVEVRLRGQRGEVFTGLGPVGWRRAFSTDLVRGVRIGDANSSTNGKPDKRIIIESDNDIGLGVWLTPVRRRWLAGALRAVLVPRG